MSLLSRLFNEWLLTMVVSRNLLSLIKLEKGSSYILLVPKQMYDDLISSPEKLNKFTGESDVWIIESSPTTVISIKDNK